MSVTPERVRIRMNGKQANFSMFPRGTKDGRLGTRLFFLLSTERFSEMEMQDINCIHCTEYSV